MNYYKYYKNLRLDELGISSDEEAEELEFELEVRFGDFTPKDRQTWLQQNTFLEHFSRIGTFSSAARETGVTVYKAQTWKFNNVLGFARRLEVATLMFNDRLKEKALRRASDPKAPVTLLIELLRAYIPEEFSRNGHKCDTSKSDEILRRFREDAQREKDAGYPRLRKLAEGATNSPPNDDHVPSYSNLSPAGGETQRGGSLHTDPHAHQPSHEPTSANRHTGGGRYPVDVPTRLIGPNQTQNVPTSPDSHEDIHHDDYPPLDTAESNLSPAEGEIHNTNLSPAGGETQRGGSLHTDPHAHQPSHEPTSANRHTGGGRYPVDVPTRLIGPNQTQNVPKWPDPHEGPHHDDYPPLDTAESNLSPARGDSHNVNLSPDVGEPSHPNLSPVGGETQRGGASRAQRREQLRQQRKAEKKNTFPVVRF